jgi:outer membrane murein-binding lipoprotein Lpp
MSAEPGNKLDELATDLDDLKLRVEELQDELSGDATDETLTRVAAALEQASDATEEFGNRDMKDDDPSN